MQGIGWNKFVDVKLKFWRYFYKMWVEDRKKKDIKIVFYEDLKTNLSRIAKDINSFIGLPFNSERLDCVMRIKNKLFKRQVLNPDHSGYFSYSQQLLIAKHVDMLNTTLVKHGHLPLPQSYMDFSVYS